MARFGMSSVVAHDCTSVCCTEICVVSLNRNFANKQQIIWALLLRRKTFTIDSFFSSDTLVNSLSSLPAFIETKGAFVWEYSGIRIYSGIYSGYSAPRSRIAGMEIQVFRNRKSSQTNPNLHYSNYSYSGLIPNERALKWPEYRKCVLNE